MNRQICHKEAQKAQMLSLWKSALYMKISPAKAQRRKENR
jgi:hypothetical protein